MFPLTVKTHYVFSMDFEHLPPGELSDGVVLPEERDGVFWHHLLMSSCDLPLRSLFQYRIKGWSVALEVCNFTLLT